MRVKQATLKLCAVGLLQHYLPRMRLRKWRVATRMRVITNYWWRIAGDGQHAPSKPGFLRALAEFERARAAALM